MKRSYSRFLPVVCLIAVLLIGCGAEKTPEPVQPSTAAATEVPAVPPTQPPTEAPTAAPTEAPTQAPTEAPTEAPTQAQSELPYLQKVSFADQSIFEGPGYDYVFAGTVKEAGTYTIVEEARDIDDNLWGKLKSGAGWIDLTQVRRRLESPESLSANYADDRLLNSGNFHHCVADPSEFAVAVAFRAHEDLTDVALYSMELTETMALAEELYHLDRLDPEKPFVAVLGFPGDITTYAIRFTDSSGTTACYCISISGRNGALEFREYTP